jgi:hypothetical protein
MEDVALGGRDTRGVLTAMLQQQEGVVDELIDGFRRNDANDAAHALAGSRRVEK